MLRDVHTKQTFRKDIPNLLRLADSSATTVKGLGLLKDAFKQNGGQGVIGLDVVK